MAGRIDVLVAENHPLFRDAIVDAVKRRAELELVGTADNGREALDEIRRLRPEVAVLDMRMAQLDGGQVLNAVVREGIATRILFLSTYTDGSTVYDVLAKGAAGYLDKASSAEQLCDAIMAVTRGETVLSGDLERGVLQQIRLRGDETGPKLTAREREVLTLIAEGLSAPEVGVRLYIEQSTVKSHLKSIYGKLGVSERAAAVAEGMRRGLLE